MRKWYVRPAISSEKRRAVFQNRPQRLSCVAARTRLPSPQGADRLAAQCDERGEPHDPGPLLPRERDGAEDLAAQFESFKDPFIIMLTVPLAIAGALIFMYFNDITMNVFSQIGIIMLIGLVAKNGILIVEFANLKQENGEDKVTAVHDAALQRLRPILMTSASTVLGLIPLAFATGEGCNQRIAMGIAVVGGMVVSTFLTMYIVPAVYSYISTNRINKKEKNEK